MSIKDALNDTKKVADNVEQNNITDDARHIVERHNIDLCAGKINDLFFDLNKELRKRMKKTPKEIKMDMYVVGGACVVTTLHSRESTTDIDALWHEDSVVQDSINAVGDSNGLGHTWCNNDFKRTASYTNKILVCSKLYREMDRLRVYMVKPELLLAMKLVAFRSHKPTDFKDVQSIIEHLRQDGIDVTSDYVKSLLVKFYGEDILGKLSDLCIDFINSL